MRYVLTLLISTSLLVILFAYVYDKDLSTVDLTLAESVTVSKALDRNSLDLEFISTLKEQ